MATSRPSRKPANPAHTNASTSWGAVNAKSSILDLARDRPGGRIRGRCTGLKPQQRAVGPHHQPNKKQPIDAAAKGVGQAQHQVAHRSPDRRTDRVTDHDDNAAGEDSASEGRHDDIQELHRLTPDESARQPAPRGTEQPAQQRPRRPRIAPTPTTPESPPGRPRPARATPLRTPGEPRANTWPAATRSTRARDTSPRQENTPSVPAQAFPSESA
jgi:hypothetical protein